MRIIVSNFIGLTMLLPTLAQPATVYENRDDFIQRAFNASPPAPSLIWLSGETKSKIRQLLGHKYPALRLRYWCQAGRSAWMLDEIGKELPITVGVIIAAGKIQSLRVLVYRENRGGEVSTPAFTDQFGGAALTKDGALDTDIDGISGATLSVEALTRLAGVALVLHSSSGCANGS